MQFVNLLMITQYLLYKMIKQ